MAGLCAVGYLYGAVIRYNIVHVEPRLTKLPPLAAGIEDLSNLALALSYFVSVAYYLNLFSAFGLRIVGVEDPFTIHLGATAALALIGVIGFTGGLPALERIEVGAVGLKLSVIGGLLASLALAFGLAVAHHSLQSGAGHKSGVETLRITLGLVILVQGFETSRYLGAAYDPAKRVRTMRFAQWISTAIYILFVFMATRLFSGGPHAVGGETGVIDMLKPLGAAAAPLLIMAALASQSSAAIADTNGASGLLREATRHRVPVRLGNLATVIAAVALTWSANIFEIITYASKAFVAYYALQSIQAVHSALLRRDFLVAIVFSAGVLLALVVIVWAIPAGA
jgi:hypothetical protein